MKDLAQLARNDVHLQVGILSRLLSVDETLIHDKQVIMENL